jgi:hypothetical protein
VKRSGKQLVYKVVYEDSKDRLWSSNVGHIPWEPAFIRLQYRVGKRRTPCVRGTKLFAFKTEDDARSARREMGTILHIYCAEATSCADLRVLEPLMGRQGQYGTLNKLYNFWQSYADTGGRPLFKGTVVCGSIKLLERIS